MCPHACLPARLPACLPACLHGLPPSIRCREEGRCPHCSSFNRLRQIAEAALPEVWRMTGRNFRSLKELALSELAIYNTQCAGVLHNVLQAAPGYVCRWGGAGACRVCMGGAAAWALVLPLGAWREARSAAMRH